MPKQPPKRLPTFAGLRLADDPAYCELIGMLADSTQRVSEGAEALAESAYCLRAVMSFISRDAVASAAILPGPLNMLHAALHDLEQGANPGLFAKRSSEGRPTNIVSRDLVKAWVAAAYDKLLKGGIEDREAASWVVRECSRLGIWQTEGAITSSRVVRWRKEMVSEQVAADQAIEMFNRLRDSNGLIADPWDRAQVTLETYAQAIMEPERRETLPFSDSGEAASS